MSEPSPSGVAGDAGANGPGPALTPAEVEAVLADFRTWLTRQPLSSPESPADNVDLFTLVAQFTALRQEVNLQTKAVRAQQEQNAETLRQFGQSLHTRLPADDSERLRPLLKALTDVADAQILAVRELDRLLVGLEEMTPAAEPELPPAWRVPFFARLAGAGQVLNRLQQLEQRLAQESGNAEMPVEAICDRIEAAASGLKMGLQRLERTLRQHGLESIPAIGRPFDPELMEVVDVVVDSGNPAGEVLDEVRRGYLWNGKVFRFAQVRVAK